MLNTKVFYTRKIHGPGGGKTSGDIFEKLLPNYVSVVKEEKEADIIHNYDGILKEFSKPTVFVVNSWKYTCPACIQCTTYNSKICEKGSVLKCSRCYFNNQSLNTINKIKNGFLGSLYYLRNSYNRDKLKKYKVIAISNNLKNILRINGINAEAIYLPINPLFLEEGKEKAHQEKDFFYSGNYDWLHGFLLLLESRKFSNLPLKTAGWGIFSNRIKNTNIKDLGLLKSQELVKKALESSYAFICPILHNNFSVSMIEAMAMLKPVIAINRGFSKEIIQDGKNGLLIEPDPKNLADAMQYLYDNETEAKKLGKNARKTIIERFHPDIIFNKYIKVYKSLL